MRLINSNFLCFEVPDDKNICFSVVILPYYTYINIVVIELAVLTVLMASQFYRNQSISHLSSFRVYETLE